MLARPDAYGGVGAFAAVPIKKGDLVERPAEANRLSRALWLSLFLSASSVVCYPHLLPSRPQVDRIRPQLDIAFPWTTGPGRDYATRISIASCNLDLKLTRTRPRIRPQLAADTKAAHARGVQERGVARVVPADGNNCQYVFTWSEDRSVWATGSGISVFYNAALDGSNNSEMKRYLDKDTFEIFATRDIEEAFGAGQGKRWDGDDGYRGSASGFVFFYLESVGRSILCAGVAVWRPAGSARRVRREGQASAGSRAWSRGSAVRRSVGRTVGRLVERSSGRAVGQSHCRPGGRAVGRAVAQSVSRLVAQSVGRSVGRSVGWSVGRSGGRAGSVNRSGD